MAGRIASCVPVATSTSSTGSTPVVPTSTTNTSSGGWTLAAYNQFVRMEFLPLQEQGGSSWIPRQFMSGIVKHTSIVHVWNIFPPFQSFMLLYNFKGDFKINGRRFTREQQTAKMQQGTNGFQMVSECEQPTGQWFWPLIPPTRRKLRRSYFDVIWLNWLSKGQATSFHLTLCSLQLLKPFESWFSQMASFVSQKDPSISPFASCCHIEGQACNWIADLGWRYCAGQVPLDP